MSNCVFARRRYGESGIPVIIFGSTSDATTYYIEIDGVKYSAGDTPPNVEVGDSIFFKASSRYVYMNGTTISSGTSGGTWTVPNGTKKIVIGMVYNGNFYCSSTPNYIATIYTGTGQTNNCYIKLNNNADYKIYSAGGKGFSTSLSSITFALRSGGTALPAIGTINGAEVYRNTATGYGYNHEGNVSVSSGIQGLKISSGWDSSNYGGTVAVTTY